MKLKYEFYKLPLQFDATQLAEEVLSLNDEDWIPHPDHFKGNSSVPLISLNGEINNDFNGQMKMTRTLSKLTYLQQVIASFGEVFGRSRLMRLSPNCEVPLHTDTSYHWLKRVRIHIPIITDENVIFHCADKKVHMAAGETWIFDSWKQHKVVNQGQTNRVHLVVDTAGSSKFWNMVAKSAAPCEANVPAKVETRYVEYEKTKQLNLLTENFNSPVVMCPGEVDGLISDIKLEMQLTPSNAINEIQQMELIMERFSQEWRQIWHLYGETEAGWPHYTKLRNYIMNLLGQLNNNLLATNEVSIIQVLQYCLLHPVLNLPHN